MVLKSADAATPRHSRLLELYVMFSVGYDPADTVEQLVELPVAEYVPPGHEVVSVAPARASCVTGPVAVHVVEASISPSYTEW